MSDVQPGTGTAQMRLEVVVVPVEDVDRAKAFYEQLGWRLDTDFQQGRDFRLAQLTPPGSGCSVHVGTGITAAAPGSAEGVLVVSDVEVARAELAARGADVSGPFHREAGGASAPGFAADRASYGTFAGFRDPDGNTWVLQEVTRRLPGRIESPGTTYDSPGDLAEALRRAEAAHGRHEQQTGMPDADWPRWYAEYMVRERAGSELPA